jgi:hypothetical protein
MGEIPFELADFIELGAGTVSDGEAFGVADVDEFALGDGTGGEEPGG